MAFLAILFVIFTWPLWVKVLQFAIVAIFGPVAWITGKAVKRIEKTHPRDWSEPTARTCLSRSFWSQAGVTFETNAEWEAQHPSAERLEWLHYDPEGNEITREQWKAVWAK